MPIEILPEQVVTQIAAGEVIERPASVVKELVENSIDSGANNVHVAISHGGQQLIRVSDDGSGILENEVELAFTRHATSKLRNIEDLASIQTLGFRGEALASIAAVSRLSVTTRHKSGITAGVHLKLEGGKLIHRKAVGAPMGTVITVENLFYNMPARLKFLKSESTEKRQIAGIVTRYAMAYPHIHFVLEQDSREFFRSNGSGQLADVVVKSLGIDHFKKMVEVNSRGESYYESSTVQIYGYASEPSLHRADRSHITLFVNGRWIQDGKLTYAIIQAYHTLLMTGRYPVAVLMIDMPPEDLDVNVHPTKAEVRFRNPNLVFETVQRAVRRAVIDFARTPLIRNGQYKNTYETWDEDIKHSEQLELDLSLQSPGQHARRGITRDWLNEQKEYLNNDDMDNIAFANQPRTLPMLRVVGQIGASYIVAEGPAGLYLIDQHAAHERILYEQFMLDYAKQEQIAQFTLSAQTIQVSPEEARLIEEYLDVLQTVGFNLEQFGPNTYIIRSLPAMLAEDSPLEVTKAITDDLERGDTPGHGAVEEKLIKRVCKRAAVKAGQILSHKEMESIIRQLERCQSPLTCPHGRPTMIHMSEQQLAREFGRK